MKTLKNNIKIRKGIIYVSIMMALVPLFNYTFIGRGLFWYLGIGLIIVFPFLGPHNYFSDLTISYMIFSGYELISFLWNSDFNISVWLQYIKIIFFVILLM